MLQAITIIALGILPALGLAAGDHSSSHDMHQMDHPRDTQGAISGAAHDRSSGAPGNPAQIDRTIEVVMDDTMRFAPDRIRVTAGDTVRFIVRNDGRLDHEMVIGSMHELKRHAEMMRAEPHMKHAEPNAASPGPGDTAEIVWRFDRAGAVDFACLVPGHLEAGMAGKIKVD